MKRILPGLLLVGVAATAINWYLNHKDVVTTDNAYVKADITLLSPEVAGQVAKVMVRDNQKVNAGDPLFTIDDADYIAQRQIAQDALSVAESALISNQTQLALQKLKVQQAQSQIEAMTAQHQLQQNELKRYRALLKTNAISQTQYDLQRTRAVEAKAALDTANIALSAARQEIENLNAQRHQLTAQKNQAQSKLSLAKLALSRTVVTAPVSGTIANRQVQVGKFVQPGMGLVTLIPDNIWLEANFKETQLTEVKPGQSVQLALDIYPDLPITGKVESITPATGAQFSMMPAQNATGNFVKVVQRVPVKITLEIPKSLEGKIYPGLSANVSVVTRG